MASIMLQGITENTDNYVIENKHFSFTVDKKNGKVSEIINLYTKQNVKKSCDNEEFIFLLDFDGKKIVPTSLETVDGEIKVTFENGLSLNMLIQVFDNFITVEITSDLDKSVRSVTFANLKTNHDEGDFLLNAVGMTAWTNPMGFGYSSPATTVYAETCTIYKEGTVGAKLGIVFSRNTDAIPFLQEVMDNIDKSVGLVSKAGGAYAREWKGNFGDYAFCLDLSPEKLDETIKALKEIGVDQYDVHQNTGKTFDQGDFTFAYTETGTATEFYEKYGKRFVDEGINLALHTYAYYINPASKNILSNPKWQKDLECLESYTLREKISAEDTFLPTVEDASGLNARAEFFVKTSFFVLIDEELIRLQITGGSNEQGIINCVRGVCGTKAVEHEAGSEIKHLSGLFSILTPKLGSDLFYHIADLTAKAYNEGGFTMLYIDAIDGIRRHLPEGHDVWYYFHMFMHRMVSQCERTPIVETSAYAPSEWNIRGRQGAWDYALRSIKNFTANHIEANLESMKNNMVTSLGWFNFAPDLNTPLKNTTSKTMFHDDLDYIGMNAIIHDMSMVYNPFSIQEFNDNPFYKANVLYYYDTYSKLRKSHYFSSKVTDRVKEVGGEWKVIEIAPGTYAFQQMKYQYANLGNHSDEYSFKGHNDFNKQTPFIRIESRYSTVFDNSDVMIPLGETVVGEKLSKGIAPYNMVEKGRVISVKIKGTGADGDAMLLSLASDDKSYSGRRDHFIDLSYTGWRSFVLLDYDNGGYDIDKYKFAEIVTKAPNGSTYTTYRMSPDLKAINSLIVRTVGDTAANAVIGDIIAHPHNDAPIKNPTVTSGEKSITFNCEMKGGEYLEYDPLTNKAILYHNHTQTTEEITFNGSLDIAGDFEATYSAESLTDAPLRARVVFGFHGEQLTN